METCYGGPRRSSTICGVEGVAKHGSAPVASRILRYQPYTGLDPLLPRIRAARAIPVLPPISCEDGTHLCPACPCPSTHAPLPTHGPRAAFQSPQFCARTTAPCNSTNANPNSMEYPAICPSCPLCGRRSRAAPSNPHAMMHAPTAYIFVFPFSCHHNSSDHKDVFSVCACDSGSLR